MRFRRFLSELERRHVYRVAVTYVVAAFAVLEAADLVLPVFTGSQGVYRVLVILALAGFPVALGLAWTYDITRDEGEAGSAVEEEGRGPGREISADGQAGPRRAGLQRTLVATIALAALGTVAWWLGRDRPRPAETPETGPVAVLPFGVASGDTTLERISQDLTITLGSALERVEELSTVEPLTVLALTRDEGGPLTVDRAGRLAGSLGARTFVHGALVRSGEGIRAEMGVYETGGRSLLGRAVVRGARIDELTDSAAVAVLSHLWEEMRLTPSPGAITTGSLDALEAYLEGERAMAEGRWRDAPASFERAIAADSTFWLAYWRLQYALEYHGVPVDSLVRARVEENRGRLPERDRLLIEARVESVEERIGRLREITTRYPSYWPAWWDLSEVLVHSGPYLGREIDQGTLALQRTLELNPRFVPAWTHLFWMAQIRRDAAEMERIIGELSGEGYDQASLREAGINSLALYRAQLALVSAGGDVPGEVVSVGVDELSGYRGPTGSERVASALMQDGFLRAQAVLARGILESGKAPPPMERAQHFILAHALAGLERWDSALVAARRYAASASEGADFMLPYRLAVMGVVGGALGTERAEIERPGLARLAADPDREELVAELAWLDGILALVAGDPAALDAARRRIQEGGGEWRALLDRSLEGIAMALEGDSLGAARSLAALEVENADVGAHFEFGEAHPILNGVHRVLAARWLLGAGDAAAARALLRWHDAVLPGPLYRLVLASEVMATPALRMRLDLEESSSDDGAVSRLRARLADRR